MKIDIVLLNHDESPELNGKTFTVELEHLPRNGESVLFDYRDILESHNKLYDLLENVIKQNMFIVFNITHPCAIKGKPHGFPTLFLKPV